MDQAAITQYISDTFAGVETLTAEGYTFFFYGPDRKLPFATIATKDHDYDRVSNLSRPSVFRLNIGISKQSYQSLLGSPKAPTGAGGNVEPGPDVTAPDYTAPDYTALDKLMPHPDYAAQSWVCVLNPSAETLQTVRSLLAEAYDLAVKRKQKKANPADES